MKNIITPSQFTPSQPAEFIGGAQRIGAVLAAKAKRLAKTGKGNMKSVVYGNPGVGKTAIVNMVALVAAGSNWAIESTNGRSVSLQLVQEWQRQSAYTRVYGSCTVKIIDELDTCPPAAQDLLLTFLDQLPDAWVFLATSNLSISELTPRMQTRLQHWKVEAPATSELTEFLKQFGRVPEAVINQIAVGSGGNVRAALLDLEAWQDMKGVAA